jgi:hypothetical protein
MRIAPAIGGAISMLSAVEFDDQPSLTADKIDVIVGDRLLPDKLETA